METLIDERQCAQKPTPSPIASSCSTRRPQAARPALTLLQQHSAWRNKLPRGHAVESRAASTTRRPSLRVDVSIVEKRPRIMRATVAIDWRLGGRNPAVVESQVQAGSGFGLSQLVGNGAITLRTARLEQSNFHDFRAAYIADARSPSMCTCAERRRLPTGAGEPPVR